MTKQIWAAEILTHTLSPDAREKLFNGANTIRPMFGSKRKGFEEVFVLKTGNQFIVFGVGASIDPLLNYFIQEPELFQNVHFYRSTESAINLLFATATGLCANVKGGSQVLDDIRNSHVAALNSGSIGLVMDAVIRQSVRVGKRIREATSLDVISSSVVSCAMDLALSKVDNTAEASVLVIGQGDVARCALEFLDREGVNNVVLATNGTKRSKEFQNIYDVNTIEAEDVPPFFHLADLVITEDLSDLSVYQQILRGVSNRKIMLDFSHASELQAQVRKSPLMTVFTMDDFRHAPSSQADLYHAVESSWRLLESELAKFLPELKNLDLAPILASCWSNVVMKGEQEISFLFDHSTRDARYCNAFRHINDILLKTRSKSTFHPAWGSNTKFVPSEQFRKTSLKNLAATATSHLN
jgi:glutamyl-tRNA reductase